MKHDQKLLEDVASQCVYAGCPAVLEARGILELVGHYDYNDEEICGENYAYRHIAPKKQNEIVHTTNTSFFNIYPNPANTVLKIDYIGLTDNAILTITDLIGRVITTESIKNKNGTVDIDISNVPNGVYIATLSTNTTNTINKRICVIH